MTELKEFRLPDVGEGLTEADIVAWHVKPGDTVEINQIIVEIETAKAVVELPSPWDGTVARLLAEEGQTVDVGTPIIAVDMAGVRQAPSRLTGRGRRTRPARRSRRTAHAAERSVVQPPPRPPRPSGRPSWSATGSRPPPPRAGRARHRQPWPPPPRGRKPPRCRAGRRFRPSRRRSPGSTRWPRSGRWPSRRCASWPRTWASAWRAWRAPGPAARSPGTTCSGRPVKPRPVRPKIWANGRPPWSRCPAGSARAARSASRSAGCASTWPRPWSPAPSPHRTSPSSCRST